MVVSRHGPAARQHHLFHTPGLPWSTVVAYPSLAGFTPPRLLSSTTVRLPKLIGKLGWKAPQLLSLMGKRHPRSDLEDEILVALQSRDEREPLRVREPWHCRVFGMVIHQT